MEMSLRHRFPVRRYRNRHFGRPSRCRNDVVPCPNDIVMDMRHVYDDVVLGGHDIVLDMLNVDHDVVLQGDDVVLDV